MTALLLEKTFAGATTCIVVGALHGVQTDRFSAYRRVLWWVDQAHAQRPVDLPPDRIQVEILETADADATVPLLERFILNDARHLPSIFVTRAVTAHQQDRYQRLIDDIYAVVEANQRARLTRQQDGYRWQEHVLSNAADYARSRVPAHWAGSLSGVPAFVVGAGPSLDVSGPVLAAAARAGVVLAADSALRALARHAVPVDFAVSIDVAKVPEKCLPPGTPAPAHVVLSTVSPPAWQKAIPAERRHFLSGPQLTEDWLASHGVQRSALSVTENCGATAIELACFLGCDPICLFGLDLAVDAADPARRHHQEADSSIYTHSNYDPAARLPKVPGNYAETVPTFAVGDWRALDARLAARSSPRIYNVNDRGARFRGTILIHPEKFTLSAGAAPRPDDIAARFIATPDRQAEEIARQRILAAANRAASVAERLRSAAAAGSTREVAQLFQALCLDAEVGRFLGAFALKLMPHLLPPLEDDAAFWQVQAKEFAHLVTLGQAV